MHPAISSFPSDTFYNSQLQDGPKMEELRKQVWHDSLFFGPYRFFNVLGSESVTGHSMKNPKEIMVALKIYKRLVTDYPEVDFDGRIGIITPYKTQLRELRDKFKATYGEQIFKSIEFNTTDAFQGREREIIIFSCVRASQKGTVGFLSDIRRMNVGLTRAKSSLFVLGNADTLQKNEFWGKLVTDAKKRQLFTEGNFEKLLERPCRTNTRQIEKRMSGVSISPPVSRVTSQIDDISGFSPASVDDPHGAEHEDSKSRDRRSSLQRPIDIIPVDRKGSYSDQGRRSSDNFVPQRKPSKDTSVQTKTEDQSKPNGQESVNKENQKKRRREDPTPNQPPPGIELIAPKKEVRFLYSIAEDFLCRNVSSTASEILTKLDRPRLLFSCRQTRPKLFHHHDRNLDRKGLPRRERRRTLKMQCSSRGNRHPGCKKLVH